jgi:hypothetical protein
LSKAQGKHHQGRPGHFRRCRGRLRRAESHGARSRAGRESVAGEARSHSGERCPVPGTQTNELLDNYESPVRPPCRGRPPKPSSLRRRVLLQLSSAFRHSVLP